MSHITLREIGEMRWKLDFYQYWSNTKTPGLIFQLKLKENNVNYVK